MRVESPRGALEARLRVSEILEGTVFAPFHYGDADGSGRAANELTMTVWDPVSKQPTFKVAAARIVRIGPGDGPAPAPTTTASAPVKPGVPDTVGGAGSDSDADTSVATPVYVDDPACGTDGPAPTPPVKGRR